MAAMTDYLENRLVDHLFRGQSFVAPTTLYIGLMTSVPADGGGGTEVAAGGYTRIALNPSLANWAGTQAAGSTTSSTGNSGTTSNNAAITFPAPTANWGSVTAFAIFDAASGGNMLWWGSLVTPKTVNNGDAQPSFAAGSMTLTLDN